MGWEGAGWIYLICVLIMVIENWETTKGGEFVECLCAGQTVCCMEFVSQLVINLGI